MDDVKEICDRLDVLYENMKTLLDSIPERPESKPMADEDLTNMDENRKRELRKFLEEPEGKNLSLKTEELLPFFKIALEKKNEEFVSVRRDNLKKLSKDLQELKKNIDKILLSENEPC